MGKNLGNIYTSFTEIVSCYKIIKKKECAQLRNKSVTMLNLMLYYYNSIFLAFIIYPPYNCYGGEFCSFFNERNF